MQRTAPPPATPFPWDDVRLFLALFRSRTMGEAADALGVNISTVSRRLVLLEEALDAALFDRGREGLRPTQAALDLLPQAELVELGVSRFARVAETFERTVSGEVRLACPPNLADVLVVPRLPALLHVHPQLRITLLTGRATMDLDRREADVALRMVRPVRGDLVVRRVRAIRWCLVVASGRAQAWRERPLASLPWVGWEHPPERLTWPEMEGVRPVVCSDDLTTQIEAVRAGLGVAVLPQPVLGHYDGLEALQPDAQEQGVSMPLFLATHRTLFDVPRIRALWEMLVASP
ncbi:MAG: LysR family transcriptional regulator [Myxococcales bacterium]|nr:LysR family transcriptional regulator [Myxococcales bacterium]